MPKDRRGNLKSSDQSRLCPYSGGSRDMNGKKLETSSPHSLDEREWEEARCPICMEHPHNAVLLICSSREKGCRPYICDTSYRHSNCLDQFRKSFQSAQSTARPDNESAAWLLYRNGRGRQTSVQQNRSPGAQAFEAACPLCRGQITGWAVIEGARKYMNTKARSCSVESCDFSGNYSELRKHARCKHPSVRPSEADPQRQSDWARLESQWDFGDTLSAYHSQFESGLDVDGLLMGYDLVQGDDPIFQEQWLQGPLSDAFFSGIHSESEGEQSEYEDVLNDLHSEIEFSFSFLNDSSFCPWCDERRLGSARTESSLLNRQSARSRSNANSHRGTSRQSQSGSVPSRRTPNSSRPAAPSRHTPSSSRPHQSH